MLKETVFVFTALVVFADATVVKHCNSDTTFEDTTQIMISDCDKPTCLLKLGTNSITEIKIVPNKDIQNLTHEVSKIISDVWVPEMNINGTNACDSIYNIDGSKSGCPLKKGVEYVYRKSYFISPLYPPTSVYVRYGLRGGNDRVICFEVPLELR